MTIAPPVESTRTERWIRWGIWFVLLLSWVVAVAWMWEVAEAEPAMEGLELAAASGPRRFLTAAAFSGMELALVLGILWPGRPAYYFARLAVMALAALTWLIITIPLDFSRLDRVHHLWLTFLVVALGVGLVAILAVRGMDALKERRATRL